ncbi:hypothetical protein PB1_10679 [Bacillus methanolicus PB1]|uniref:Uncharacterized protein n=1 Tax=Bacillus methanolicus PB1 TaxID=997296 RepID=I3DUV3_BACMT|nr:hypothetical protein PB1_10679 [Bacillus methanolicus PB1]
MFFFNKQICIVSATPLKSFVTKFLKFTLTSLQKKDFIKFLANKEKSLLINKLF